MRLCGPWRRVLAVRHDLGSRAVAELDGGLLAYVAELELRAEEEA